jgi:hypothetical protein
VQDIRDTFIIFYLPLFYAISKGMIPNLDSNSCVAEDRNYEGELVVSLALGYSKGMTIFQSNPCIDPW